MAFLSQIARKKKLQYFFKDIPKSYKILEIGCGDYWLGKYLKNEGFKHYQGLDLQKPADIVGDIKNWKRLKIKPNYYDVVVAFELVEHVDCFKEMHELLKPGGVLMLTSPLPSMDWLCLILEKFGLNQKRTSPHDYLINFKEIPLFKPIEIKIVGLMSQGGKFKK